MADRDSKMTSANKGSEMKTATLHNCTPDGCKDFDAHDYEAVLDAYQLLYNAVGPALRDEAERVRHESRDRQ